MQPSSRNSIPESRPAKEEAPQRRAPSIERTTNGKAKNARDSSSSRAAATTQAAAKLKPSATFKRDESTKAPIPRKARSTAPLGKPQNSRLSPSSKAYNPTERGAAAGKTGPLSKAAPARYQTLKGRSSEQQDSAALRESNVLRSPPPPTRKVQRIVNPLSPPPVSRHSIKKGEKEVEEQEDDASQSSEPLQDVSFWRDVEREVETEIGGVWKLSLH